ncbi:MAG: Nramp family divalent metal transporter [Solirubrobacterales bacterium]
MKNIFSKHSTNQESINFLKYLGPGLLVTVGFIDPGNWASNIAAGSIYGYSLLWIVTLSTIMLILLQHNAAHLGIVTGKCLSEAATENLPFKIKNIILITAVLASISTALAEILGAATALNMLFYIPIKIGSFFVLFIVLFLQLSNSYKKIEKIIIGFVSLIGLSFIFETSMVHINWTLAAASSVTVNFPKGSMLVIMSVLGAVVMPHNLFLHSEIIQSRQWNLQNEEIIKKQLKYEFTDTMLSMIIGWAINSCMILLAAAVFFESKITVTDLSQAQAILSPILGNAAGVVFALALLFAGVSSSITAGMAGGSIFAGIFGEPYNISDLHTKTGVLLTMVPSAFIILLISSPFLGLIYSQMFLSVQLPITIFTLIYLTSSKKVMGIYANSKVSNIILLCTGIIVTLLNVGLLISVL